MVRKGENNDDAEVADAALAQWRAWAADFFSTLFDLEFRRLLTPRMMPTLYVFGIAASALAVGAYIAAGFVTSVATGFVRLFLTGPLMFVVLVVLARVSLEFCLAVFRIAVHVNKMAGHTEEIAAGLPRIQFWKPLRKKEDSPKDF